MHYLLINNHRTFGDFYEDLLGASALSRRDGADLQVAGNLIDRPFKKPVVDLFDISIFMDSAKVTLDLFDVGWGGTHHRHPSLAAIADPVRILTHHDVKRERVAEYEEWIPEHKAPGPNDLGDYIALHWRSADSPYRYRHPDKLRDISQAYAIEVVSSLLDTGHRVIRFGHGGTVPLDLEHANYGELFSDDATDTIQVIAHAKAVIEITPSGPAAMAIGFRVPLLRLNMREEYDLPFGNEMVMQHADFPESERVSKARAKELGLTFTMLSAQEASDAAVGFISRRLGER